MQPSEFWLLSPQEWWWEFDAKFKAHRRIADAQDKAAGKFTETEWEAARRIHKEKMKNRNG